MDARAGASLEKRRLHWPDRRGRVIVYFDVDSGLIEAEFL
jgi:hypothetical protein